MSKEDMTQLLKDWREGDSQALRRIEPIVYETLKRIAIKQMRKERPDHTLQATALVNDAYMQLLGGDINWADSAHFRALSATIMRRTLIDHARAKRTNKRGGDVHKVTLIEANLADEESGIDVLEMDDALNKLAGLDERAAKVIELTFFGGMTYAEVGEVMGISKATVDRKLRIGKSWLYRELHPE